MTRRIIFLFAGSLVAACGSPSDDGGDGAATANEGVFAITGWTLDEGCDGGAVDVSGDNPALLGVGNQVIIGARYVKALACGDDAECRARLEPAYVGPVDASFLFGEGDDVDGYIGFTATAGSTIDGGCEGQWADHSLSFDGSTLRIESERTAVLPIEPDGDGFCTSTEAEAAARGAACAELEVVEATLQ